MNSNNILSVIAQDLTSREKEVLFGRFGIDKSGKPQTLAGLGNRYGVTRERIRQIEVGALKIAKKNIAGHGELLKALEQMKKFLKEKGGVSVKQDLLAYAKSVIPGVTEQQLSVVIEASRAFYFFPEDKQYRDFYYLDKKTLSSAQGFIREWVQAMKAKKSFVLSGKYIEHLAEFIKRKGLATLHAESILNISRELHVNPYGDKGLAVWPEIRPKTIRDRVYLVLRKHGKPLHFRDIARTINEVRFDAKKASAPTVHNELIKDERFVLVGRGMYGLSEHGYTPGTAKEVIHRILAKTGPLTPRQIIMAVQKERFFKANTVLVNLQNRQLFNHLEDGTYRAKEA
jgi:hypothetical protein